MRFSVFIDSKWKLISQFHLAHCHSHFPLLHCRLLPRLHRYPLLLHLNENINRNAVTPTKFSLATQCDKENNDFACLPISSISPSTSLSFSSSLLASESDSESDDPRSRISRNSFTVIFFGTI